MGYSWQQLQQPLLHISSIFSDMKYYIISGEASGDLHGSNLIRALNQKDPKAEIRGWGGDLM